MLTENDKALISEANKLNCIHWGKADSMIAKADTEEAKEELRWISRRLYHKEEYLTDKN
ncbi:MAG: hypothetical protein KBD57_09345 [Bacteroidia bacterium]|nr:hypothetical protein [Bacteroidia bacterium]